MRRRSSVGWAVVLVILDAIGACSRVGFAETPPAGLISAVRIECRVDIDEDNVRRLVGRGAGDVWDPAALPDIVQRLQATELFSEVEVIPVDTPHGVEIVARLVRKPVVNSIRFHGNDTLSSEQLRQTSRLQEGTAYTIASGDYAVERIRDRYRQEGFEAAEVRVLLLEPNPGDVDVAFEITEGEPVRVLAVDFDGDLVLPVDELRDAVDISSGDRLRRKLRREAEQRLEAALRRSRYYEADVDTSWNPTSATAGVMRFGIDSGPLVEVTFTGNEALSDKKLLGLIDFDKRVVVTDGTWRQLARLIRQAYQEEGFYLAKVALSIDASAPQKTVSFKIEEGESFRLAPLEFEGRHHVPLSVLREAMLSGPPSWIPWRKGTLVDETFQDDLKRLWYLYRRWGFLDAQIADYRIKPDRQHGEIVVTVILEEGPQTMVRALRLEGFDDLEVEVPPLLLEVGEPLNSAALEADGQRLTAALLNSGYLDATVASASEATVEGEGVEGASVSFAAQAGTRARVGKVIVQNNFDTRARVVRRELPFAAGDVLSTEGLLLGQSNIYRLGLFRSVTVEPLPAPPEGAVRDVAVNVAERPPISVQFGAGYNTRDGFRGFTELAHANLQGRARRLSLRGEIALDPSQQGDPNEYLGDLGFREPRILDSRWNIRADLIVQRATRSIDQFSIERLAFISAIERLLLPGLQTGLELQVEDARIFDVQPDVLAFNPRDEGRLHTTSIGPYLIYEGRDDAFEPTQGVFASLRARVAPGELGSDVPFVKIQAHHSQYIPILESLTFVYAVRGGWARAIDTDDIVSLRERFFLGGRSTVRGFAENSVGPEGAPIFDAFGNVTSAGGDPLGGDLAINLNAELRVPLLFGVSGVVFTDGGGVYLQERPIRFEDFRRSAGLGLLYATPVGPIALHYGFKLDRRRDESLGEIHFSIGTVF